MKNKSITGVITGIFYLAVFVVGAAAQSADFSGTWKLDKTRSEGVNDRVKDITLVIEQKDDIIDTTAKISLSGGDREVKGTYILNEKENEFSPETMDGAKIKGIYTAKWIGDALQISKKVTIPRPDGNVIQASAATWKLAGDGKTLTIENAAFNPNGIQKSKLVYRKS